MFYSLNFFRMRPIDYVYEDDVMLGMGRILFWSKSLTG